MMEHILNLDGVMFNNNINFQNWRHRIPWHVRRFKLSKNMGHLLFTTLNDYRIALITMLLKYRGNEHYLSFLVMVRTFLQGIK